jgi:hypothetical protein
MTDAGFNSAMNEHCQEERHGLAQMLTCKLGHMQLGRPAVHVGRDVASEACFDRFQDGLQVRGILFYIQIAQALNSPLPKPCTRASEPQDNVEQRASLQAQGARACPNRTQVQETEKAFDFLADLVQLTRFCVRAARIARLRLELVLFRVVDGLGLKAQATHH